MSDATEKKRLKEQAEKDRLIEIEYLDWEPEKRSQSPERLFANVAAHFNTTPNAINKALERRARLKGEDYIDPRTI